MLNYKTHIKSTIGFFLSLLVIGGLASCASGAKIPKALGRATDPIPMIPAARAGTLPSGLKYYILENPKPENRAYLTLAVHAGSVMEKDDEQGLAHFVEHMAFNGTERFPEAELVNYLRSLGMRFGPEVNAYTSFEETVYGIEVPLELDQEGLKRIPDTALAVLDDWTHRITFDPQDVDDERPIIMEEYRSRLGATERLRRKILPVIFRGSPYENRMPIGLPEIFDTAPASKLQNFYKTWYRADNMALIFVGDFDGAALEDSLESHFSIPKPETSLKPHQYDLPPPKKGEINPQVFTDPELSFTQVQLYYKRPQKPRTQDLGTYRQDLMDALIDQILSVRFEDAAAQPETPYMGAWAGNVRYGNSSRYYILGGQAKTGTAEGTLQALLREKESLSRYGFTQEELNLAKRSLESGAKQLYSEKDRQESDSYIYHFTEQFLRGTVVTDIAWDLEALLGILPGIGLKEINAAVKDYFTPEDLTVLINAPESEEPTLPSLDRIPQLVAAVQKERIPKPKTESLSDKLLTQEPKPGSIVREQADPETGALIWELSNGGKVILQETANRNNEVIFYAVARGGTASVPESEDRSARLAAEMVNVSGVGTYSLQELQKKLTGKQVALTFWTSPFIRGFEGFSTKEDLKTFFELLHLYFTQPKMDPSAVQAMMDQYRTALTQQKENPQTFFSQEIQRTISGNNPRFVPMEAADLDLVNKDDALGFIRKSLNPGDYTFVFTGNLNQKVLRSVVETYLASIPQGQTWNTWTDPQVIRPGKLEKALYKGKEERSTVYLGRYIAAPYSEEEAAAVSVLNEYLDIRLTEEIREKRGGVYSISVNISLNPFLSELGMSVYFGCDPKRVEELTAAVEQEIQRILQEPVDPGVFTKAVEALKKTWETSKQSNRYIARNFANLAVIYNLPLSRLNRRPVLYAGVTPQDLQEIVQRLLEIGPTQLILYPENRK